MTWFDLSFLNVIRSCIGIVFLVIASAMDLKSRIVSDKIWIAMSVAGLILLETQLILAQSPLVYHLLIIPIVIILADVFIDREPLYNGKKHRFNILWLFFLLLAGLVLVLMLWDYHSDIDFLFIFTVPAMMIVSYVLYNTNILHGGADAKALISIAILLPIYPQFGPLPIYDIRKMGEIATVFIPYALTVLMNSAIIAVFIPIIYAIYNFAHKDIKTPAMFLGYRVPLDKVDYNKMWLMQKVEDDKLSMQYMPDRDADDETDQADSEEEEELSDEEIDRLEMEDVKKDIEKLREHGVTKVWITPKLPFIALLAVGLIISLLIGNLLFGLMWGIINFGK